MSIKKISSLTLLLFPLFSYATSQCPPANVFHHPAVGEPWQINVDGSWVVKQQPGTELSPLKTISESTLGKASISYTERNAITITCQYITTGQQRSTTIPMLELKKRAPLIPQDELPNNFISIGTIIPTYQCFFLTSSPEKCSWD